MREHLCVFVVEDEALLALDLEDILDELGHEVVGPAGGVDEALSLLKNLQNLPDAAVVDANLGGQTSLPVVKALGKLGVSVLVASGYGKKELTKLGFDTPSINKPYSMDDLRSALQRCLP